MKLLIVLSLAALTVAIKRFDGDQVLTLHPTTVEHLQFLQTIDAYTTLADFWYPDNVDGVKLGKPVEIHFQSAALYAVKKQLRDMGMDYEVKIANIQTLIDNQFDIARDRSLRAHAYNQYNSYEDIISWANTMSAEYPDLVESSVLTTSEEGRNIPQLVMGNLAPDAPIILIDCGMHAREWISPAVCQCYVNRMLSEYEINSEVNKMMTTFKFIVLPLLNVDGYVYSQETNRMWRKTRSLTPIDSCVGVDPNRNFDAGYGGIGSSGNPCSDTYYGPSLESEKLTQGLSNIIRGNQGLIEAYFTFHSYSQIILFPYSYIAGKDISNKEEHLNISNKMVDAIYSYGDKTVYEFGEGHEILYYASGGSDDMAYDYGAKFSFTVELRDTGTYGFLLPESQIEPSCEENYLMMDTFVNYLLEQKK